jgi:hypothetical protein
MLALNSCEDVCSASKLIAFSISIFPTHFSCEAQLEAACCRLTCRSVFEISVPRWLASEIV